MLHLSTHERYYFYNLVVNIRKGCYGLCGIVQNQLKKNICNTAYLQTDGYAAYNQFDNVPDITTLNCWAHARRKFIDTQSFDAAKASEVLTQIQLLYAIEKHVVENNYPPDEIKFYRQQYAVPILNGLHELLKTQQINSFSKSPFGMALQYTLPGGKN